MGQFFDAINLINGRVQQTGTTKREVDLTADTVNIATQTVIGRGTSGTGKPEIIALGSGFSIIGGTLTYTPSAPSGLTTAMFAAGVVDTDITFAANSDTRLPSQKAVKSYIDNLLTGLVWKASVRVATTASGTLSTAFANGQTVDGVVLATGDRILLKNQSTGSQNGIYIVAASGSPTRATDADSAYELYAATTFVREGTVNADTQWTCTNDLITLGSTSLVFAQVSGAGTYSAGALLSLAGNQFSVADIATASLFYRKTAGTGPPEVQTLATLKTDLGLSGTNTGDQTSVSGNAGTATALQTPRTINGVSFNGTANITVPSNIRTQGVFSGCRIYRTTSQSIPNNSWTSIEFDTEDYDTDSYHSVSGSYQYITIPSTGFYTFGANIFIAANASGGRYMRILVSGLYDRMEVSAIPSAGVDSAFSATTTLYLAAGVTVELQVLQTSGSTLNCLGVNSGQTAPVFWCTALGN